MIRSFWGDFPYNHHQFGVTYSAVLVAIICPFVKRQSVWRFLVEHLQKNAEQEKVFITQLDRLAVTNCPYTTLLSENLGPANEEKFPAVVFSAHPEIGGSKRCFFFKGG